MLFRLSKIRKSYGGNEILRDVSFQINANEKVGLVGRNGAGKTTVFKLIIQEETQDSGEISKISGLRVGMLEQHVDFSTDETVHTAALSAFQKLHDIEAEMRDLEKQMESDSSEGILERYSELQTEFEREGGFEYTARAEAILLGLGFPKKDWGLETKKLSGGQKNRLGMARLLLSESHVLLLDEPTNHLDVTAVEWLENFLQTYGKSYVIITHDRYFLDKVSSKIIEIENGSAYSYTGNYTKFLVQSDLRREQQKREYDNQQAFIIKTQAFIRKNLAGQKTKQAKSRRNMLERMERVDSISADRSGGNFDLKEIERAGTNVLSVEDLEIGYGESILARDIGFRLLRGECLGVIGGNGTGKTTLLKTIIGEIREMAGKIIWGTKTSIGYYSQQLEDLDRHNDVINELRKVAPVAENGQLRSFLARFLFFGDDVFKRVGDLSGGEKGRLSLAKLIYSNVNVLILDEPTNHLDIPSREALEGALREFEGTIVTVSHDRYFLDQIATQIFSFESEGKVEIFNGNYSEFHDWKESRELSLPLIKETKLNIDLNADRSRGSSKSEPKELSLSKNEIRKIKERVAEIEEIVSKLEEDLKKLTFQMNQPKVANDHEQLKELLKNYKQNEKKLQEMYSEWENILEKID